VPLAAVRICCKAKRHSIAPTVGEVSVGHPEERLAIRLNNSQDTAVAENSKTRVEAATQLYDSPQLSAMRNADTSRIPNPIRDDT
jgi:hypothetical protein